MSDIGVILTYSETYIFPSIMEGINAVAESGGHRVIYGTTLNYPSNECEILLDMLDRDIAGLIVDVTRAAMPNAHLDLFEKIKSKGVKLLFIHGGYRGFETAELLQDDEAGGYLACKTLIENGHRKIGGIFKRDDIQGEFRYKGFLRALVESGIEPNFENYVFYEVPEISALGLQVGDEGYDAIINKTVLLMRKCTGMVAYNDSAAQYALRAAEKHGIASPQDVSIVSFDNSHIATEITPHLTSIVHPQREMGERACKIMLDMIENNTEYGCIKIPPSIVLRDSVRKLD